MSREELAALCADLQKFLRLSDWRVDIDFAKPRELGRNVYARVTWVASEMRAKIRIRSEESILRAHMKPAAYGYTLAHELVHMKLEGHEDPTDEYVNAYEAGVDHLAEITWNAYRNK